MRSKYRIALHSLLCILLVSLFLFTLLFQMTLYTSGTERYFSGDAAIYYEELLKRGFPEDYATALTELHLLHPTWEFAPLMISEQDSKHTWSYVIDQETKDEDTNLISKSNTYSAYWHEVNRNEPETGYYQPSRATVEYFMDPRNFLNETDIFQFYDLASDTSASLEAIEAVLAGTFMEEAVLENGKTYAQTFLEIGDTLNVNPVYLAVKVRQEQGVNGTSPIISGTCGSLLHEYYKNQTQKTEAGKDVIPPTTCSESELLALDGYYNYFNIKASGVGVFEIYQTAMLRAREGTAQLADTFGGSPSWNARWKSLYGGAYFLKTSYIDRYQSTIYLQKFNVDNRSGRTFWGQYMASVFGAMNEGRTLYQSFASIGALDAVCYFLIPVYAEMPQTVSPDPANSTCTRLAVATTQYNYRNELTKPARYADSNATLYLDHELYSYEQQLSLKGVFTHSYGVEQLEYRWDDGAWQLASSGKSIDLLLEQNFSENTSHILTVRGKAAYDSENSAKKSNSYFLCAVIYVKILPPPTVTLKYQIGNTVTEDTILAGSNVTLPSADFLDFAGWLGSDGSFLPSAAEVMIKADTTYRAIFLEFEVLPGASLGLSVENPHLRFSAVLRNDSYEALTSASSEWLQLSATFLVANEAIATTDALTLGAPHEQLLVFHANTPTLTDADYHTSYSVTFYATLNYTNGESATLCAVGSDFSRSATEVATMALLDASVSYTQEERLFLTTVAEKT